MHMQTQFLKIEKWHVNLPYFKEEIIKNLGDHVECTWYIYWFHSKARSKRQNREYYLGPHIKDNKILIATSPSTGSLAVHLRSLFSLLKLNGRSDFGNYYFSFLIISHFSFLIYYLFHYFLLLMRSLLSTFLCFRSILRSFFVVVLFLIFLIRLVLEKFDKRKCCISFKIVDCLVLSFFTKFGVNEAVGFSLFLGSVMWFYLIG